MDQTHDSQAPQAFYTRQGAGGIRSWIFTLDHKRIGMMYLVSILTAFFLGGILAVLMRTGLLGPRPGIMDAETYNRTFTLHGAIMIFLFIIPVWAGFGNYIVPLQVGALDMAFPRINALSFWVVPRN